MDPTLLPILTIILLATTIRSAFGFGEALIAVPLLALIMPVEVAAPLAVLLSITVAAVVVAQDWRDIHFRSAWRLLAATLLGIPAGLLLLIAAPEPIVKGILGAIIIAFSAWSLARPRPAELSRDALAYPFGFAAGVLGGAYGMNGPPLVIYGTLRRWSPQQFRATLQGYFLPASMLGMAGYWASGLWTAEVTRTYLISLPIALAAILLGRFINRRMTGTAFLTWVHIGLIAAGAALLLQIAISTRQPAPAPPPTSENSIEHTGE